MFPTLTSFIADKIFDKIIVELVNNGIAFLNGDGHFQVNYIKFKALYEQNSCKTFDDCWYSPDRNLYCFIKQDGKNKIEWIETVEQINEILNK